MPPMRGSNGQQPSDLKKGIPFKILLEVLLLTFILGMAFSNLVEITLGIILMLLLAFVSLRFVPKVWDFHSQGQPGDSDPLFEALSIEGARCRIESIGDPSSNWRNCDIEIYSTYVAIRFQPLLGSESFTFNESNIRWLGEPKQDELWLDIDIDGQWHVVQLLLPKPLLRRGIVVLEQLTPDELLLERNRHHPNIRRGPVEAHPAEQNLYGAWLLGEPVELYLTPLYLLVLDGGFVRRRIPLSEIEYPEALPRVDAPDKPGLMRFQVNGESLAFALPDYMDFAQSVADDTQDKLEKLVGRKRMDEPEIDETLEHTDNLYSDRLSSKKQM